MSSNTDSSAGASPLKKSDAEWRKILSPEAYRVAREGGTERPYTGQYDKCFRNGVYRCVCCGTPLFSSDAKFDSGCGWPAFSADLGSGGDVGGGPVERREDCSLGMQRTEVTCRTCDGHLGHVFEDGPAPTGERYCINSASLNFESRKAGGKK